MIVTALPTGAEAGERLVMLGEMVNETPLLARPLTVTTTFPVVAPVGTGTTMVVALQLVGVAAVPLKVTVLAPCDAPKFVPVMVTEVAAAPEVGLRLVMLGGTETVNGAPLLANPPTVMMTLPVVEPEGTGTTMLVALQLVGVAAVPLKVTVLVPCEAPKFVPLIVTEAPTRPDVGDRLMMLGGIANDTPLLAKPEAVTTTLPLVAPAGTGTTMLVGFQLVGVAGVPLKVMVLEPCACVEPKLFPVMVTGVPTAPPEGLRLLILGAMPNIALLLVAPEESVTVTPTLLYAERLLGTMATMLVSLQLVMAAATEPIIKELVPWVAPKPVPVIVTELPAGPEVGLRLEMSGPAVTVKATPLLATPLTVTTTLPLVAAVGTATLMAVLLQLEAMPAETPLKVIVLVPWVAPKLPPDILTNEVGGPSAGLRLVMVGAGVIEKFTWLLASPNTTT